VKVVATTKTTHNPFNETHRVSCLRENLTSSSDGEGLETGCALSSVPRQSFTRQLDLRSIKAVMQMDILRCKTPEMVCKEIAVHLLAYNLVRAVMAQAAYRGNVLPPQLSFKGALDLLNAFAETLHQGPRGQRASCQAHLLASMARLKLPDRPGRVEPRAVKRRPKPHRLLTKPRHTWRARLVRQQEKRRVESLR
jgi:hypothetical protein